MSDVTIDRRKNRFRDWGKPRPYVTDQRCKDKPRYSGEVEAGAAALVALDSDRELPKIAIYRCPHCHGWHLTKGVGGRPERFIFKQGKR